MSRRPRLFAIKWLAIIAARLLQALAATLLGYVLLFALAALFAKYPLVPETSGRSGSDPPGPPEIRGAFHIHSTLSDGRGTPSQIAQAAKSAGLQFIILADHNLQTLSLPTFEHGVLVITGVEASTWQGHLVAVGARGGLHRLEWEQDPVWRAQQLGALTIIAHPVQPFVGWTEAESAGRADGMELYSANSLFFSAWKHPLTLMLPAAAAYLTNPMHGLMILSRAQEESTQLLLDLSVRGPKLAVCAQDAHGFPPYELEFRAFSLHVPLTGELQGGLPSDASQAARAVIDAISLGRAYCVFDALGSARGFAIEGLRGTARRASVGDRVTVRLPPFAPTQARVRVWGNGHVEPDGQTVLFDKPGPVQIEAWAAAPGKLLGTTWRPWIVPSPIFVSPAASDQRKESSPRKKGPR